MNKSTVNQWASAIHHLKTQPSHGLMPPVSSLLKATSDPLLKVALQLNQLTSRPLSQLQEEQINQGIDNMRQFASSFKDQSNCKYLLFKLLCLKINHQIFWKDNKAASQTANSLVKQIQTLQDMRFSLKCLFGTPSLIALTFVESKQLDDPLEHIAMVVQLALGKHSTLQDLKISVRSQSAFKSENQALIYVITILGEAQRSLISKQRQPWPQTQQVSKHSIKRVFEKQAGVQLQSNQQKTMTALAKIDFQKFASCSPLAHYYYETNPTINQSLKQSHLTTRLSAIDEASQSSQSKKSRKSSVNIELQQSHMTRMSMDEGIRETKKEVSNPKIYQMYQNRVSSENENLKRMAREGRVFIKYNFNNSKSSQKKVLVSPEAIMWVSPDADVSKASREELVEVQGIIYGKASARHQQSESLPEKSFSVVCKQRTLDLSLPESQNISTMFGFVRGLSFELNASKVGQIGKLREELEGRDGPVGTRRREKINNQVTDNKLRLKQQTFSRGRMLWSHLLLNITRRFTEDKEDSMELAKLRAISEVGKRIVSQQINKKP